MVALLRGEFDLFRAEMDQNVKHAFTAIGMIVAGIVVMLVALNVLASALVAAITGASDNVVAARAGRKGAGS